MWKGRGICLFLIYFVRRYHYSDFLPKNKVNLLASLYDLASLLVLISFERQSIRSIEWPNEQSEVASLCYLFPSSKSNKVTSISAPVLLMTRTTEAMLSKLHLVMLDYLLPGNFGQLYRKGYKIVTNSDNFCNHWYH